MSTSVKYKPAKATDLWFADEKLYMLLADGREIAVPLNWFPGLEHATEADLNQWRFIGDGIGIHWESLDEDISVEGVLRGDFQSDS